MTGPKRPLLLLVLSAMLTMLLAVPAVAADRVVLSADDDRPAVGQEVVLTARVDPQRAGRPVVFQRRDGSTWVRLGTDETNRRGVAAVAARFDAAGRVTVRAVAKEYRGDPQRTDSLELTVVKAPTTVAATFPAGPWRVSQQVTVPVQVTPAVAGRAVVLERDDGGSWARLGDPVATGDDGRAVLTSSPTRSGPERFRVAVAASPTHKAAWSAAVDRQVLPDESEHLDVIAPDWVTVGSQFQVEFAVGHDVEDLEDAALRVTVPAAGSHVVPPDELVLDAATGTASATLGDQPAGPLRRVPLRWQAPAAPTELTVRVELTATGVTETAEAAVDVVPEPGPGIVFDGGLQAMEESRDAPLEPEGVFTLCMGGGSGMPPPVPTYEQALSAARAWLAAQINPDHADAWEALAAQEDPDLLDEVLAVAIADQRPAAALAASLRAHELQPSDGLHLSNAAAAANMLDRPEWGIAFAVRAAASGPASSVGVRQEAVRLVNLGHAHALRREWAAAEAALRQAVAVDPGSGAVHAELGKVMACRGNKAGALPHLRRGLRTDDAPDPIEDDESMGSSRRSRLDTSDLFDLSGGVEQHLELPYFPAGWAELAGMSRSTQGGNNYYEEQNEAVKDRAFELLSQINDLESQMRSRQQNQSPVQVRRTNDILRRIGTHADREIRRARADFNEVAGQTFSLNSCDGMFTSHPFCSIDGMQYECGDTQSVFNEYERRMEAHLTALATYHDVVAPHFSGLQAQLADPVAHALAGARAHQHLIFEVWEVTTNLRWAADHFDNYNEYWDGRTSEDPPCVGETVPPVPDPVKTDRAAAPFCAKDSLESEVSLNLEFEAVSISVGCEEWSVEGATGPDWLSAYGKYEAEWGNNGGTMYVGVKSGALGASFESCLYLEHDREGKVVDFGWQVGPELSAGGTLAISAYEDKVRISFMSVFTDL